MVDKRDEANKLIDELIAGKTLEEIVGEGGLFKGLTKGFMSGLWKGRCPIIWATHPRHSRLGTRVILVTGRAPRG